MLRTESTIVGCNLHPLGCKFFQRDFSKFSKHLKILSLLKFDYDIRKLSNYHKIHKLNLIIPWIFLVMIYLMSLIVHLQGAGACRTVLQISVWVRDRPLITSIAPAENSRLAITVYIIKKLGVNAIRTSLDDTWSEEGLILPLERKRFIAVSFF